MCGRFSLATSKIKIAKQFECVSVADTGDRYNIAPSQNITAVIHTEDCYKAVLMRWGLIPSWVKNLATWKGNLINARVETIDEKPSFRTAFQQRPCLIPVSGFYEWTQDKQPYYFHDRHQLLALAGIWETWANTEEKILSCTILTTKAKGAVAKVHHRMPAVIPAEYYDLWLGKLDGRKELLEALPEIDLQVYPVCKAVNSPQNDSSDCVRPIEL